MDGNRSATVLAMRDVAEVIVIDGGDTLSIKFVAADASDAFVLLPLPVASTLIGHLRSAELDAQRLRQDGPAAPLPALRPGSDGHAPPNAS